MTQSQILNLGNAKLTSLQAGFFLTNPDLNNKLEIIKQINENMSGVFDGEPVILPIPEDAPKNIPRIILNSKDNLRSCNISLDRIDFFINDVEKSEIKKIDEYFLQNVFKFNTLISSTFNWNIYRLALITSFKKIPKIGSLNFIKKITNNDFMGDCKEAQIHRLRILKLDSLNINQWTRVVSQCLNEDTQFIIINNDTNTVVTEKRESIDDSATKGFFKLAMIATNETITELDKYDK